MLQSGLNRLNLGFGIVDRDLRLVTCNRPFASLRGYPEALCRPGTPLADLLRHSAARGDFGPGDPERHVRERMAEISELRLRELDHVLPDGRTLHIRYEPLADGGMLLTYEDVTAARSAEAALRASEERYALVTRAASEGIYEWNVDSGDLYVSDRLNAMFKFQVGELRPENWNARVHPDDYAAYKRALVAHFTGATAYLRCEYRIRDRTGAFRWVLDNGIAVRDARGRAVRLVGAISDVTERKSAEAALRESEERYTLAMRAINEGVYDWNAVTDEIYYSPGVYAMVGLTPAEMLTRADWTERIHPDDLPHYRQTLIAHLKGQSARFECEFRYRGSDGGWRWARQHGLALRGPDGRAYRMAGSAGDITELKQSEAALAEKTAILEATLENMDQGISMVDGDLNVIAFNHKFLELLDFPAESFKTGFHMSQAFRFNAERGEYGPGDIDRQVQDRLDLARRFEPHHFERVRPDGTVLEIRGVPLPDAGGFVTTYTDITARKQAEQALLRQNDRLRQEIEAHKRSKATIEYLLDEIKSGHDFEEIIGDSPLLRNALAQVEQVAATDSTVLIQGETGTGKELFVRAIHDRSPRRDRPLVKVNCAALPRDLVESELFGHEKGAFTGATQERKGRFELADKGTIFLDEIGELPVETQAKLLRVLQEHEFERVGGARSIRTDVRVIAATNRDLAAEVQEGRFRSDLYFRLSVFPLTVPPLRQRRADVPLLVTYFVERFARKLGKRFDGLAPGFLDKLQTYSWPGNVRELENVIERAAILSPGPMLQSSDAFDSAVVDEGERLQDPSPPLLRLEDVERDHISRVLAHTGWVIEGAAGAASILGLNPSTLRGRMRKLGIRKPA